MPEKREKIIDEINVTVLGSAKKVLTDFQKKGVKATCCGIMGGSRRW